MAKSVKPRSNEYYRANAHRIVLYLRDVAGGVYTLLAREAKGTGVDREIAIVALLLSGYPELLGYICASLDMSRGERAANGKGRPQTKTTTEKVPRGFVLLDNGGQSHDRYTILETVSRPLSSRGGGNFHPYLRFSVNPYSSYGKMSYGELNKTAFQNVKSGGYAYFGKRINLSDLAGSGAHMTALAYIQDSAAESKSDRAALKRKPNHHRTGILSEDYPMDPYRRDLAKAYDPYDAYWRSPNGRRANAGGSDYEIYEADIPGQYSVVYVGDPKGRYRLKNIQSNGYGYEGGIKPIEYARIKKRNRRLSLSDLPPVVRAVAEKYMGLR